MSDAAIDVANALCRAKDVSEVPVNTRDSEKDAKSLFSALGVQFPSVGERRAFETAAFRSSGLDLRGRNARAGNVDGLGGRLLDFNDRDGRGLLVSGLPL